MNRIARLAREIRAAYARHLADTSWALTWTSASGFSPKSAMISLETAWGEAKAIERADDEGLVFEYESSYEPWDGDCPAPKYLFDCFVKNAKGEIVASVGMVGVDSLDDPCLEYSARAELFAEALAELDERREQEACRIAAEMAERATYASV